MPDDSRAPAPPGADPLMRCIAYSEEGQTESGHFRHSICLQPVRPDGTMDLMDEPHVCLADAYGATREEASARAEQIADAYNARAAQQGEIDRLRAELEQMRTRAIVAEQHKTLDRLGRSSYQEVIEDELRTKLAEAEIRAEKAEAVVARLTADRAARDQQLRALVERWRAEADAVDAATGGTWIEPSVTRTLADELAALLAAEGPQ